MLALIHPFRLQLACNNIMQAILSHRALQPLDYISVNSFPFFALCVLASFAKHLLAKQQDLKTDCKAMHNLKSQPYRHNPAVKCCSSIN